MKETDKAKAKTGAERRRHRRSEVATIILVAPNGNENRSVVYDMSRSGARISIPRELDFGVGSGVRLYFPRVHGSTIMLGAKIVRVELDNLGLEFGPGQEATIHKLLESLSPD
jgi:hypothetical protein